MSPVHFRPAQEADFEAITAAIASWWDSPGFDTEAARRERAALVPRLWLQHFHNTSLVASDADTLIGFLVGFLSPAREREAYIHFAAVNPDHRRHGLARELYRRFFALCRDADRDIVRAITSPGNSRSIAFHRALGFDLENYTLDDAGLPVQIDYDGPTLNRVAMVCHLEPAPTSGTKGT